MADSQKHGEKLNLECEGASGVSGETKEGDRSQLEVVLEEESSASTSTAADKREACEGAASGTEGQSPTKNKKVSFHPTPIVISESDKEWESSSKGTSSDTGSDSSGPVASHTSPSAELAALHFKSREFLESQGVSDFSSDETSGDSEASDQSDPLLEVSLDELQRVKTHNLCKGKEELREKDVEIVQKSFSFAKFKLEACLRRTLVRCNKEMSAFENMTKDLLASFRDLFVILCIRSPLEERTSHKLTELGSQLVGKITAKSLAAFNRQYPQNAPSGVESAIKSWYSSAKLSVLKELSDMEKAELDRSKESTTDGSSASGSASASK